MPPSKPPNSQSFPEDLLAGYRDFRARRFSDERARYQKLADEGQTPSTLIIACCDSRAAPEMIFNVAPGEIFVVRNVANQVPPFKPDGGYHSTSAALEFAVQALKVQNIVVLGHGRCGGIQAALDPAAEPLSPGDFIGKWMDLLKPAAQAVNQNEYLTGAERQTALERISIRHSIKNLLTFPCIKILADKGKLALHGAWFDIHSGELWVLDPESGDFKRPDMGDASS
ncbi:MAG: carbonic anhydrase [Rhodospirillaceae bacterium]